MEAAGEREGKRGGHLFRKRRGVFVSVVEWFTTPSPAATWKDAAFTGLGFTPALSKPYVKGAWFLLATYNKMQKKSDHLKEGLGNRGKLELDNLEVFSCPLNGIRHNSFYTMVGFRTVHRNVLRGWGQWLFSKVLGYTLRNLQVYGYIFYQTERERERKKKKKLCSLKKYGAKYGDICLSSQC